MGDGSLRLEEGDWEDAGQSGAQGLGYRIGAVAEVLSATESMVGWFAQDELQMCACSAQSQEQDEVVRNLTVEGCRRVKRLRS